MADACPASPRRARALSKSWPPQGPCDDITRFRRPTPRDGAVLLSRILLDTQAYVWFVGEDPRLSDTATETIEEAEGVLLSIASLWELGIKSGLGKLETKASLSLVDLVTVLPMLESIEILPVLPKHVVRVAALPYHHRDPFDRMIIAQALEEGLPVVSSDTTFDAYIVNRLF